MGGVRAGAGAVVAVVEADAVRMPFFRSCALIASSRASIFLRSSSFWRVLAEGSAMSLGVRETGDMGSEVLKGGGRSPVSATRTALMM